MTRRPDRNSYRGHQAHILNNGPDMSQVKPNTGQYPHFMRDVYGVRDGFTPLSAVWFGVKVMWWPRDGQALVVVPTNTPSRLPVIGKPFYPVPVDLRILIPYVEGPELYVPEKGMRYKDARAQVKRRFWVSMDSADPYHVLIDWEIGATLGPTAEYDTTEAGPLVDSPASIIDVDPKDRS